MPPPTKVWLKNSLLLTDVPLATRLPAASSRYMSRLPSVFRNCRSKSTWSPAFTVNSYQSSSPRQLCAAWNDDGVMGVALPGSSFSSSPSSMQVGRLKIVRSRL